MGVACGRKAKVERKVKESKVVKVSKPEEYRVLNVELNGETGRAELS